jgi:hypothetical protein
VGWNKKAAKNEKSNNLKIILTIWEHPAIICVNSISQT